MRLPGLGLLSVMAELHVSFSAERAHAGFDWLVTSFPRFESTCSEEKKDKLVRPVTRL